MYRSSRRLIVPLLAGMLVLYASFASQARVTIHKKIGSLSSRSTTRTSASASDEASDSKPDSAPAGPSASAPARQTPASRPTGPDGLLIWDNDYAKALTDARQNGRPMLVRAGATWCGWCKQLDKQIAKPAVQDELRHWSLAYVDVDNPPNEARSLAIGPVPAFRVLSPSGRVVASRNGYLESDQLIEWLKDTYTSAEISAPLLAGSNKPTAQTPERLIKELDRRDPAARETAIRRLILSPERAAKPIVEALTGGSLGTRLGALEVLQEWGAPVESLDPWQPDTLVPARLEALRQWAASPPKTLTSRPKELTPSQLILAHRDITKLLNEDVTASEADAVCERLARYGQGLLPEVYDAMHQAASDRVRERLTGLRYRLVASDDLAFGWAGGLQRLSSLDVETRHKAAEELAQRATFAEEPLLLELFSDPDSMVREISLRALNKVAGKQASGALARLLKDPEPNVRAAVLKQLAETPSPSLVPKVAEYVASEKDADLVVHAVRVLRAATGKASAECLLTLLGHGNWQVRAEAAEALGEIVSNSSSYLTSKTKKEANAALFKLLDDSDGFVVSVAVKALKGSDLGDAVDSLAKAADKHPELAADVLGMLGENSDLRAKAAPHLRRFCTHENPTVRAVAIEALCAAAPTKVQKELTAALKDGNSRVRIAAATALFRLIQAQQPRPDDDAQVHYESRSSSGLVSIIARSFRSSSSRKMASQPVNPSPESMPSTAAATATASADATEITVEDRWLERFRSGPGRPAWMTDLIPLLEPMLKAESPEERLVAAMVLVPFGRDGQVLPILQGSLKHKPDSAGQLADVLPWLPWASRVALYRQLLATQPGPGGLRQIIRGLSARSDPQAASLLWEQLGDKTLDKSLTGELVEALRRVYFGTTGSGGSSAPLSKRRRAIADATDQARRGTDRQRIAALALLLGTSLKEAGAEAARIVEDTTASGSVREDAFRIQLLSESRVGGQKLAIAALAGKDTSLVPVAIKYLAEGGERLRVIWSGSFYLSFQNSSIDRDTIVQSGQAIKVAAPTGLKVEMLKPLLDHPDPRLAAEAGYLLATLKDPAGMDKLVSYWRAQAYEDELFKRLVYRAVAALDDDSRVPVLNDVYKTYAREKNYGLREFYWTIRDMAGPNAVQLRKQIRDQVGMNSLQ